MKSFVLLTVILCALILARCSYVTGETERSNIADRTSKLIKIEKTTKQEVLLKLGEPFKVWHGETMFLYADFSKDGIPLGPGVGVPVTQNFYLLLIEFDDSHRVKKFEVKKKSLPGTITIRSNRHLHRRALLDQLTRWVNQLVNSL